MIQFGALSWSIVLLYLGASLGLGWMMSRRVKTADDYYLGARSALSVAEAYRLCVDKLC